MQEFKTNKSQLEVINHHTGNCCVVAAAGSGKSSCVVNRVKHLIEFYQTKPSKILCITFTKKSKDDLKRKLSEVMPLHCQQVNTDTFHSLGYKIIRTKYGNKYTISDNSFQFEKIIKDIVVSKLRICDQDDIPTVQIKFFIGVQKNKLLLPTDILDYQSWKSGLSNGFSSDYLSEIYRQYEIEKERLNLLDFDDLMIKAYLILTENTDVLKIYQDKYDFISVDEFQDTSNCQIKMLQLISAKENLLAVGDMRQAIYSWRGSDNEFMMNFHKYFPKPKIINLDKNYRSTEQIINYSNDFANKLVESKSEYYKPSQGTDRNGLPINYKVYDNEYCEANDIALKIKELTTIGEVDIEDIMVISRTNAQLSKIEMALSSNNISSVGFNFTGRNEIKLVLSYLKLALDVNDNESFEYCYSKPLRWLGIQFLQEVQSCCRKNKFKSYYCGMFKIDRRNWRFRSGIDEIVEVITYLQKNKDKNAWKAIKYLRKKLKIDDFYNKNNVSEDNNASEITENLSSLEDIASKSNSIGEFLEYIKLLETNVVSDSGVNLTTIHKAKGLESKIVFVIGVSERLLPHARNENIDEEKRLYYVAITRAMDELYVSSVLRYNSRDLSISSFLTNK